jgi:hypothetical protein
MIERKITIGLITNLKFLEKLAPVWNNQLIESATGRMICSWIIEYYNKYKKAPGKEIETIFYKKVNEGLDKDLAEEIETDILPGLSDEYEDVEIDVDHLLNETLNYLNSRKFSLLKQQIDTLIEDKKGPIEERLQEAEKLRNGFQLIKLEEPSILNLSSIKILQHIDNAFKEQSEPVIKWPKQLGQFWNSQFVPGGFVAFLAPEKRGKTWQLLECAMRAVKQGKNVAFIQAGDMNEANQIKRIGTYLVQKSYSEKYCVDHYESVRDCIRNQMDECDKKIRECDFGLFLDKSKQEIQKLKLQDLIKEYHDTPDYRPCYNCMDYNKYKLGTNWIKFNKKCEPASILEIKKAAYKFFVKYKRNFILSTHANGTLSTDDIENLLQLWWDKENFAPHVVILDYMDLLAPTTKAEFRHQENQKWKDIRKLSQIPRNNILPLWITATQSDSDSYKKNTLELSNYSEDKRKYGHVTGMYGLNQSPDGREKELGLLRINEIILREDEYLNSNELNIIQNLKQGRPYKGAYFS